MMEKYCNCSIYLSNLQNYYLDTRNNEIRSSFSRTFVAISMILCNTAEVFGYLSDQSDRSTNKSLNDGMIRAGKTKILTNVCYYIFSIK